jgi:hypothetical protein
LLKIFVAGYDTVYAQNAMPEQVRITDATIIQPVSVDKYGTYTSQVSITFSDPAGERNYYELFFEGAGYDDENKITDPVLLNEGDIGYFPSSYFFSDELFDGQEYTMTIKRYLGHGIWADAVLRNISKDYYLYRKYWTRHSYNQIGFDREVGNLIYAGEPLTMFNNIVNGYGIFAGYVENEPVTLRLVNKN